MRRVSTTPCSRSTPRPRARPPRTRQPAPTPPPPPRPPPTQSTRPTTPMPPRPPTPRQCSTPTLGEGEGVTQVEVRLTLGILTTRLEPNLEEPPPGHILGAPRLGSTLEVGDHLEPLWSTIPPFTCSLLWNLRMELESSSETLTQLVEATLKGAQCSTREAPSGVPREPRRREPW